MSFLFASSHLPETTRRRNLLKGAANPLEEEPEDDDSNSHEDTQPMRHSGSVRAFSHLPMQQQPVRTFRADPAPRRISPPNEPESDTGHAPEPYDDNAAHGNTEGDAATDPHAPEDGRPWYLPRITLADLQAIGYDQAATAHDAASPAAAAPTPWEHPAHHAGFDAPDPAGRSASRPQDTPPRPAPATQSIHDSLQSPTPDSPAQPYRPALPQSRLLEKRSAPQAFVMQQQGRGASGPASQQRPQTSQTPPAAPQTQPSRAATPPAPGVKPAAQSQPPVHAGQSMEKSPTTNASGMRITTDAPNPHFEAATRAALADESANSPVAAALQKEADRLGISIVPQKGLNLSQTKLVDGKPVIYFSQFMHTDTTMSHEIAHAIEMAAAEQFLEEVRKTGKIPDGRDIDRSIQAGRDALNKIVPVKSDEDKGQDYKENDAMRVAHIVNAERTATEMKDLPEEQKTLEEFQRRIKEKEDARGEPEKGRKHPNNDYPIPAGTERGSYDNQYLRDVLGLDEKGRKKVRPLFPVQPLPPSQKSPPPSPLSASQPVA